MPEPDLMNLGAAPAPVSAAPVAPTGASSGLAINNPLNLRPLPNGKWPGQTGVSASGFAIFDTPEDGWAAADQNLQAKVKGHGLGTLAGIIGDPVHGWAPAGDHNDPTSYASTVAGSLGVKPTDDISQKLLNDPDFRHSVLASMAGVETGKPQTFGGVAEPDLMTLGGVTNPKTGEVTPPGAQYTPGTGAGTPPAPQALAFSFLAQHGFRDENAPLGSSTNPAGQLPNGGAPSEPGSWYVTPQGQLRKSGDDTPDYLPQYQKIAAGRAAAEKAPLTTRIPTALGQGAGWDIAGSINKLSGGAATPNTYMSENDALAPDDALAAQRSLGYFQNERNQYDLLHHGDPVMAGARFVGQAAPITALTLGTGAGLSAAGAPGEFLAGEGSGNLLTQGLSRATGGALQGAQASALTTSTNDRPALDQIGSGALLGAGLGVGAPAVAAAGERMVYGGPLASGPVTDLATTALSKYGIPLRAGQIRGAAGDRGAWTADSNLLGSSPKFAANNEAQKGAFMKALTSTYGDPSGVVAPQALEAAKGGLGQVFDRVAQNTKITNTDALQTKLGSIVKDAQDVLPDNEVAPLLRQVQNIGDQVENGTMSGAAYQALTRKGAPLDRAMNSDNPNVAHYAGQVREALDDALEASAAPQDLADLQKARFQYKNLMTVAKLAPKADANGFISPPLLRGAVNTNFKNAAFKGAGNLGELARIGQTFMKEPPNSFTANRAKDLLSHFGTGGLLGGEALGLYLHNPLVMAGAVAPIALQKAAQMAKEARLGPGATNRLLGNNGPSAINALTPYAIPAGSLAGQNLLVPQPQP